jgi:N-acyl homoserine lactone hydrolase
MIKHARTAILSILVASSFSIGGTWAAAADSRLPDPAAAGFAEKLYRLDCGHSLANDESGPLGKMLDGVSNSRQLAG